MALKPHAMELEAVQTSQLAELTVETAAVPTHRFVKSGSARGTCELAGDAEAAIGLSLEHMKSLSAFPRPSDYDDYAVGDEAMVVLHTTRPIMVECDAALTATAAEGTKLTAAAGGKARAAIATEPVNAVLVGVYDYDGTDFALCYPVFAHGGVA